MKVTRVLFYGEPRGNFLRYSTIVVDSDLVICGIKLINRTDGTILVAMPERKKIDDTYEEIVRPVNKESRKIIEDAVLSAWATFPRVLIEK